MAGEDGVAALFVRREARAGAEVVPGDVQWAVRRLHHAVWVHAQDDDRSLYAELRNADRRDWGIAGWRQFGGWRGRGRQDAADVAEVDDSARAAVAAPDGAGDAEDEEDAGGDERNDAGAHD